MKKRIAALAAALAVLAAAGCGNDANTTATTTTTAAPEATTTTTTAAETEAAEDTTSAEETTEAPEETEEEEEAPAEPVEVDHDGYVAANNDDYLTVETYIQAKQGWWENNGVGNASFYAQNDPEGGYFFYNMPCTEEEYAQLTPGTKVKVTGYKAEWSGEVELVDTTFEIIEGDTFVATAEDVTDLLANTDELIKHQNEFVSFKGMTVEKIEAKDEDGNVVDEGAFFYRDGNTGTRGDDLYFNVSKDGSTYTFTVESYLCGDDTEVYQAVEALSVGDVIDLEGFLYWYNGANPHITSVTKA